MAIAQDTEVGIDAAPAEPHDERVSSLPFAPRTLDELLNATAEQLAICDIARMNLLCATGLPGAEKLDIARCLHRLDFMARQISKETERDLPLYRTNPRWIYKNAKPETDGAFRMSHLACAMQDEFKMHYDARFLHDPKRKAKMNWRTAFADSRAILIHGLLGEKRAGIFTPLSFVAVAIGRRLGYPVHVTGTPSYDFVRWDGQGDRFNAEINGGGCHIVRDDAVYHKWPEPMRPEELESGYFLRNYMPADELALCLCCRARVLECNLRFEESLPVWAKCCFLAPKNPDYARKAKVAAGEALFMRKKGRAMEWAGKRWLQPVEVVDEDPRDILPSKLAALAIAILGHVNETEGNAGNALRHYRTALDTDPENHDLQKNFERFRDEFHEQIVQNHIQREETIRGMNPKAQTLPLEESVRRFRRSLATPPPGRPAPSEERMRKLRSAQARFHRQKGVEAMRAGKYLEGQTRFAQAYFGGDEKEREIFIADLRMAITTEIEAIAPPNAKWEQGEDADPRDDPLFKMPDYVNALVWHNRGVVLEQFRRYSEAANAYEQAVKFRPGHDEYVKDRDRVAALAADPHAAVKVEAAVLPEPLVPEGELPSPQLARQLAAAYARKGMECVREGKWDRAQAAFARAHVHAGPMSEKRRHLDNLFCAIRDELNAAPMAATDDLRLTLPPKLQAFIWAARGKVLHSYGRLKEAADAYLKSYNLEPRPESYENAVRLSEEASKVSSQPPGLHQIGLALPPPFDFQDVGFAMPPELICASSDEGIME